MRKIELWINDDVFEVYLCYKHRLEKRLDGKILDQSIYNDLFKKGLNQAIEEEKESSWWKYYYGKGDGR